MSLEIHFSGWQAGHGDVKHAGRASLLLRAPALRGLRPTVSREHRKKPRSEYETYQFDRRKMSEYATKRFARTTNL
jgi:hypothetical protein